MEGVGHIPGQITSGRRLVVSAIAVAVGIVHFLTGPDYRGPAGWFVNGYLIDILLPFSMFLLLGIAEFRFLRSGFARSVAVFGVGAVSETLQYCGVPIFGRTFDPLDYLMFALGTVSGAALEAVVWPRGENDQRAEDHACHPEDTAEAG